MTVVVVAHIATYQFRTPPRVLGGFIGVDVFFVISGYLITGLLMREVENTGRISLANFYARRARRILPAATLVLLCTLAYAAVELPVDEVKQFGHDARWSAVFLANWHFAHQGLGYWDRSVLSPFRHFWSLGVEEQFYVVWPLLLGALAVRLRRSALAVVASLLCLASLAYAVYAVYSHPSDGGAMAYYSSLTRAYELGIGAVIAIWRPRLTRDWVRSSVGLGGLVTIVAGVVIFPANAPFPGWEALIPTVATAAVLVAGAGGQTTRVASVRLLSVAPLQYLGNISYSLYLWHFPIIVFASNIFPVHWRLRVVVPFELAVMMVIASLSYFVIERPFQRGRVPLFSRNRRALVLWPLTLALVFGGNSAAFAYASHVLNRQDLQADQWFAAHPGSSVTPRAATSKAAIADEIKNALRLADEGAPAPAKVAAKDYHDVFQYGYPCVAWWKASKTKICAQGDVTASKTVVLMGDSHAGMWIAALDALGKKQHFKLIPLVKPACNVWNMPQYFTLEPKSACDGFKKWVRAETKKLKPSVIVISAKGQDSVHPPAGSTMAATWTAGVKSGIKTLVHLAPKVFVLGDIPARSTDPVNCLTRRKATQKTCVSDDKSATSAMNPYTKKGLAGSGAIYVNPVPLVCQAHRCPAVVGNMLTFYDDNHLTDTWSRHVGLALGQLLGMR